MREEKIYPWTRFWFEAGARPSSDDDGFLPDPTTKWTQYLPVRARPFNEIASVPCLILLGEPGMGKTRTLRFEEGRLKAQGEKTLWLEFGRLGSTADYLIEKVFRNSSFTLWQGSGGVLHLFLDALDEGRVGLKNLHKILTAELRERTTLPERERLFLRLSCRTAEWPAAMGKELEGLWGRERYGEFQLAPLREIDVETAATARGFAPGAFLSDVRKHEVEPFAARPITLEMLLAIYGDNRSFPKSKVDLYQQGCRTLCEEEILGGDRQRVGRLSSSERLSIACRLAALTVFTHRNSFQLNPTFEPEEKALVLSEIEGGQESVADNTLAIREPEIRETFELSGLFTGLGGGTMTWAHQTYAEFLAAKYLIDRQLSATKILSLLVHPEDPARRIPPSLHATASWLASLSPEILDALLESDAEVLLRSDTASFNDAARHAILERILTRIEAGSYFPDFFESRSRWRKLNHPHLKEQLEPFIIKKGSGSARFVAFQIAGQCRCEKLQREVLAVALNHRENIQSRSWAIQILEILGDAETRASLRPLLFASPPATHKIISHTLEALWPVHVSASEAFALLARARTKEEFIDYSGFLAQRPAKQLRGLDVIPALNWLQNSAKLTIIELAYRADTLVEDILLASWEAFGHQAVINHFAEAILTISRQHFHLTLENFLCAYREDRDKRYRFLTALLSLLSGHEEDSFWVFHYMWRLHLRKMSNGSSRGSTVNHLQAKERSSHG